MASGVRSSVTHEHGTGEAHRKISQWCECLVGALYYIHTQRVRHKDIKPANILIFGESVLIADFGIAAEFVNQLDPVSIGTQGAKTPMYAAPEQLDDGQRRGTGTDVFSLGCVFLEMLTVSLDVALTDFTDFRTSSLGLKAFSVSELETLQWFTHLASVCGPIESQQRA
ncbi:MAG: hypothetical protein M1838_004450 [Thelocarpon superellum]|nr:MAG: hypothetical protein M1838_004450 [Thelocarpon superellum]